MPIEYIYTQRLLMIAFYLYIKPPKLSVADRLETEICLYIYTAPPNTQSVRLILIWSFY